MNASKLYDWFKVNCRYRPFIIIVLYNILFYFRLCLFYLLIWRKSKDFRNIGLYKFNDKLSVWEKNENRKKKTWIEDGDDESVYLLYYCLHITRHLSHYFSLTV